PDQPLDAVLAPASAKSLSTRGKISGRSSAMSPGPNASPHLPCSQAPAAAASKLGMPWPINPEMRPVNTSPDPAVARNGVPGGLTTERPPGAATTVSAPFSNTTQPAAAAAARAASILDLEASSK